MQQATRIVSLPYKASRRLVRKSKPKKRSKVPSVSKRMKEADKYMSLYVRQKYADKDGNVKCYTCPYVNHWKKMQNGHLVSRFYKETRYDERNCRPQCYTCNMFRNGMIPHFAAKLQEELGNGIVEELYEKARQSQVYPISFFEEQITIYKNKLPTPLI